VNDTPLFETMTCHPTALGTVRLPVTLTPFEVTRTSTAYVPASWGLNDF
jgi:hypothetical protein